MKKALQNSITIKIEDTNYVVKFPSVGEFLEIENAKMSLSNGQYANLLRNGLKTSTFAVLLIDAIATFSVLIPELRKTLSVRSFEYLDVLLGKKLVIVYEKQFFTWWSEWTMALNSGDEELEEMELQNEAFLKQEKNKGANFDLDND